MGQSVWGASFVHPLYTVYIVKKQIYDKIIKAYNQLFKKKKGNTDVLFLIAPVHDQWRPTFSFECWFDKLSCVLPFLFLTIIQVDHENFTAVFSVKGGRW